MWGLRYTTAGALEEVEAEDGEEVETDDEEDIPSKSIVRSISQRTQEAMGGRSRDLSACLRSCWYVVRTQGSEST